MWPIIILLLVNIIYACAICWKDILLFYVHKILFVYKKKFFFWLLNNLIMLLKRVVKIYNKTIFVRDLFIIEIFSKYIIIKINPKIVKYFYKISNQPITKRIFKNCRKFNYFYLCCAACGCTNRSASCRKGISKKLSKTYLLLVGISETLRAKTNDILILFLYIKHMITIKYTRVISPAHFFYWVWVFVLQNNRVAERLLPAPAAAASKHQRGCQLFHKYEIIATRYLNIFSAPPAKPIKLSNSNCINVEIKALNKNEKILDNHNNEISLEFKQWFAGLTDGDGYIYVNKGGSVGFELTLNSMDEKVLRIIQNKFGGKVHAKAGFNAIRYRTQNKNTVYKIIQCLNGLVINNIRLAQLHKACLALNIPIKDPVFPDIESAYISGLLDADGYINIYKIFYNLTYRYQLTITISNNSLCNIDFLSKVIGGKSYFDKKLNGHYKWVANSKLLHLKLYDYFLKFPPKTIKGHRTFLIKEFHELNDTKAYLEVDKLKIRYKIWQDFVFK